jgi:hypothetical protein
MKPESMNTPRTMLAATLAAFAVTGIVVACAESSAAPDNSQPDAQTIPPTSTDADSVTGADDAGCESDASDCGTTPPVSCEGVDWCPALNPADTRSALTAVWGTSKNDVWAVGSGGAVIHFDGSKWKDRSLETTSTLFSIGGSGPNDAWIVGTYGTILHRTASGVWELQPIVPFTGASEKMLFSVWSPAPDQVWIGGESLKIPTETKAATQYRRTTVDGGARWQAVSPCPTCTFVRRVWGPSPDEVWSVGALGKAYRTTPTGGDGGAPVSVEIVTHATQDLLGVWGSSKDDVWLVGRRGTIRRCRAGSTECETVETASTEDLYAVWGSADNDVWVVGDQGTILHFDGTSFHESTAAFPGARKPTLYGVWGSAGSDVWIVGEKALLHFTGAKQ